jgi:hypothetical protein
MLSWAHWESLIALWSYLPFLCLIFFEKVFKESPLLVMAQRQLQPQVKSVFKNILLYIISDLPKTRAKRRVVLSADYKQRIPM